MYYFDNWSSASYLYLALHGTYGLTWILKDFTFPDAGFERPVTLLSALVGFFGILVPYMYAGYLVTSG